MYNHVYRLLQRVMTGAMLGGARFGHSQAPSQPGPRSTQRRECGPRCADRTVLIHGMWPLLPALARIRLPSTAHTRHGMHAACARALPPCAPLLLAPCKQQFSRAHIKTLRKCSCLLLQAMVKTFSWLNTLVRNMCPLLADAMEAPLLLKYVTPRPLLGASSDLAHYTWLLTNDAIRTPATPPIHPVPWPSHPHAPAPALGPAGLHTMRRPPSLLPPSMRVTSL